MFLKNLTKPSTERNWEQIKRLKEKINQAEAVLIGAGAGLSTSAGYTYSGERFRQHFQDFNEKYGINDMYSGGFYPFETPEENWAYWSRLIYHNRYDGESKKVYQDLLQIVKNKNYFVLTTNVDHQFQLAGFDQNRLFYTQGDYGLFQCSVPCHSKTYENEGVIRRMVLEQENMRIPQQLIPKCPICGEPMTMNLRSNDRFVEDAGWQTAATRYAEFVKTHQNVRILYLELGVGYNTPGIIKFPFWRMTAQNQNATYASINLEKSNCPVEIEHQAICVSADIGHVLEALKN
ncbi:MAG: Sir2 silent information regulator family NAD-dependent deacetylase [Eubacteriaceae bacterium]|nr:Sir2 silent information regulator family NAD-dependent deacetylase [Eubacteriaceae bacterium]